MTEAAPPERRPGPWDIPRAEEPALATAQPENKPQPLVWAILSTVLLAGWLGYLMGWVWALAGVVGVFVHEYGHVLAMNRLGCGPGRIHIIPFLGGAAVPARAPDTEFKDVLISLAGPSFGLLASIPFFAAHAVTGQGMWLEGALFIAIINLINLLPAPPLDGSKAVGPALAKLHPMVERAALLIVAGLAILWALNRGSYIFAAFVAFGAFVALRGGALRPRAIRLSGRQWAASLALYFATIALCAGTFWLVLHRGGARTGLSEVLQKLTSI